MQIHALHFEISCSQSDMLIVMTPIMAPISLIHWRSLLLLKVSFLIKMSLLFGGLGVIKCGLWSPLRLQQLWAIGIKLTWLDKHRDAGETMEPRNTVNLAFHRDYRWLFFDNITSSLITGLKMNALNETFNCQLGPDSDGTTFRKLPRCHVVTKVVSISAWRNVIW